MTFNRYIPVTLSAAFVSVTNFFINLLLASFILIPNDFGIFTLNITLIFLAVILITSGLPGFFLKQLRGNHITRENEISFYLKRTILLFLLISISIFLLSITFSERLEPLIYFLPFMTAEICKEFLITKSKLLKNYYLFLYFNVAPITLRALFVAYLFLFNKDIQLNNFVLIFGVLSITPLLIFYKTFLKYIIFSITNFRKKIIFSNNYSWKIPNHIIFNEFSFQLQLRYPILVSGYLLTEYEISNYAFAWLFVQCFMIPLGIIQTLIVPQYYERYSDGKTLISLLFKSLFFAFVLSIATFVVGGLLEYPHNYFYSNSYPSAFIYMFALLPYVCLRYFSTCFTAYLKTYDREKNISDAHIWSISGLILLNIILFKFELDPLIVISFSLIASEIIFLSITAINSVKISIKE